MKEVKRGDVYYICSDVVPVGNEIWPNRPAIVISNEISNRNTGVVNIVYLSTSKTTPTITNVNTKIAGKKGVAMCSQIHTVDISKLGDKLCKINNKTMKKIENAIIFNLSIKSNDNCTTIFNKYECYIKSNNFRVESVDEKIKKLETELKQVKQERDMYANTLRLEMQKG